MLALVLVALVGSASAQECIRDERLKQITTSEITAREEIQGFSRDGMWKMPKLAQHAREEQLEDCASCTDAEVQVELMQAQMGENPLLNDLDGVYYPIQNVYTPTGFKLNFKDIPHEVPQKVHTMLEHRTGSLNIAIEGYRMYAESDADRLIKNKEDLSHLAPEGMGPFFMLAKDDARKKKNVNATENVNKTKLIREAKRAVAEYASHVHLLKDIEKSSPKGSGVYLILQEGFVMSPTFKQQWKKVVAEAPKDWDILFLRTGPSTKSPVRCEDKVSEEQKIYEMRRPVTTPDGLGKFYNGIDGYVVRRQSLPKLLRILKHSKAAPLSELLMSVHTEEKERLKNGKINYNVDGVYSYAVNENLLQKVEVPRPPAPKPLFTAPVIQAKVATKEETKPEPAKKSLLQSIDLSLA